MLTNEVPEVGDCGGVSEHLFSDLDKGKPQDSQGHGTFMLNSLETCFFRFLNFHYDIVMSD